MANGFDPVGAFLQGRQARQQNQLFEQQLAKQQAELDQQAQVQQLTGQILSGDQQDAKLKELFAIDPKAAEDALNSIGLIDQRQRDQAANFAFDLINTAPDQRAAKIQARAQSLQAQGRDPSDTLSLLNQPVEQQDAALRTVQQAALSTKERAKLLERQERGQEPQQTPAGVVEFESLTADLTPEQVKEAKLIKLGLSPRAVGSAIQTIADKGIEDEIGNASAVIKEREKFGAMTGASRSKIIDSGFERIQKIDAATRNIDRAISALEKGAGTGAIERFLPSIKAASVELDNIQGSMALDVVGATTFGALSKGELDLSKQVALPTGLSEPELIDYLKRRRAAQNKLRAYFDEQIQHLDQGGTVASFLRAKERQSTQQPQTQFQDQAQGQASGDQGQIMVDANGNRARVFADGTFEEL